MSFFRGREISRQFHLDSSSGKACSYIFHSLFFNIRCEMLHTHTQARFIPPGGLNPKVQISHVYYIS